MFPDIDRFIAYLAVVCVIVGVALAFGIPWLWSLVKPLLHAVTA